MTVVLLAPPKASLVALHHSHVPQLTAMRANLRGIVNSGGLSHKATVAVSEMWFNLAVKPTY